MSFCWRAIVPNEPVLIWCTAAVSFAPLSSLSICLIAHCLIKTFHASKRFLFSFNFLIVFFNFVVIFLAARLFCSNRAKQINSPLVIFLSWPVTSVLSDCFAFLLLSFFHLIFFVHSIFLCASLSLKVQFYCFTGKLICTWNRLPASRSLALALCLFPVSVFTITGAFTAAWVKWREQKRDWLRWV